MNKEYTPAEAKAWLNGYDAGKAFVKKEWVGLTIEERTDIRRRIQEYTPMDNIKYGEAVQFFTEEALKEKNSV